MLCLQFHRLPPCVFLVYITLLPGLSYLQSISNQLNILFWLLDHIWSNNWRSPTSSHILLGNDTYRDKTRIHFVQNPLSGVCLSFPGVNGSYRVLPPLNAQIFHRPYFSYPKKMVKILLHRVTTHKIHISTNNATLFILKWLQSLASPLHVSTQHLNIKEKCFHFYYSISFVANSTI